MTLFDFLSQLMHQGRVYAPPVRPTTPEEIEPAWRLLEQIEQTYRLELPGRPPPLDRDVATWAASQFFLAAQFLVDRDAGEELLRFALQPGPPWIMQPANASAAPAPPAAAIHYSVDLTFRFLPDLYRLASAAARQDPLVAMLKVWGARWPLSSPGVPWPENAASDRPTAAALEAIADDDCLLRLYVDRIIASRDAARLASPRIREAVRAALGLHRELSRELALALDRWEPHEKAATFEDQQHDVLSRSADGTSLETA